MARDSESSLVEEYRSGPFHPHGGRPRRERRLGTSADQSHALRAHHAHRASARHRGRYHHGAQLRASRRHSRGGGRAAADAPGRRGTSSSRRCIPRRGRGRRHPRRQERLPQLWRVVPPGRSHDRGPRLLPGRIGGPPLHRFAVADHAADRGVPIGSLRPTDGVLEHRREFDVACGAPPGHEGRSLALVARPDDVEHATCEPDVAATPQVVSACAEAQHEFGADEARPQADGQADRRTDAETAPTAGPQPHQDRAEADVLLPHHGGRGLLSRWRLLLGGVLRPQWPRRVWLAHHLHAVRRLRHLDVGRRVTPRGAGASRCADRSGLRVGRGWCSAVACHGRERRTRREASVRRPRCPRRSAR